MNIGLFTDCYYPQINGVTISTATLKLELENRGHKVYVITVKSPATDDKDPSVIRIPSIPFTKWKDFRVGFMYPPNTLKKIYGLKLDIIHTQTEFGVCITGRAIAKALKIPVIHTYHTLYEHYTHYLSRNFLTEKFAYQFVKGGTQLYLAKCNLVIAPSKKTKKILKNYHVKTPIKIIPSGIKLSNFDNIYSEEDLNQLKNSHGINKDDFVLLSLGRISEEKSLDVLVRQFDLIKEVIPNAKLLIVGDGPYMENLKHLQQSSKFKEHIVFTGQVPWEDTGKYYNLANVFISASKTETQGLTIFEALAAKLPIIVREDENILNYITHMEEGLIFDDEADLPEMVTHVYTNEILRKNLILKGTKVVENMSAKRFGINIENTYLKVLNKKKKTPLKKSFLSK